MQAVSDLFDLQRLEHPDLFAGERAWDPLKDLLPYLRDHAAADVRGDVHPTAVIEGPVRVGASSRIDARSLIRGSVWIGGDCFVSGSLVRDSIIESGALIGNGCEIARSIIMRGAQIYHNSVVLDSIVGAGVSIGGGTLLGNTNLNDATVHVEWGGQRVDTGLMKLGPLIGDGCRFGMGCLVFPGAILGKNSLIGAGVHLSGSHPPYSYVKAMQTIRAVVRRGRRRRAERS